MIRAACLLALLSAGTAVAMVPYGRGGVVTRNATGEASAHAPGTRSNVAAIARRAVAEETRWDILSGEWKMMDSWTNKVPCAGDTAVFPRADGASGYSVRISPESHPIGKVSLALGAKLLLPRRAKLAFGATEGSYCPYLTGSTTWKEQVDDEWISHPHWTKGVPCGRDAAVLPSFEEQGYSVTLSAEPHPIGRISLAAGAKIFLPINAKLDFGAAEDAECSTVGEDPRSKGTGDGSKGIGDGTGDGSGDDSKGTGDGGEDSEATIIATAAVDAAKAAVETACADPESSQCATATVALEVAETVLAAAAANDAEDLEAIARATAAVDAAKAAVEAACADPESSQCATATAALELAETVLAAAAADDAEDSKAIARATAAVDAAKAAVESACVDPNASRCAAATADLKGAEKVLATVKKDILDRGDPDGRARTKVGKKSGSSGSGPTGIIVGILVAFILLALLAVFLYRKRQEQGEKPAVVVASFNNPMYESPSGGDGEATADGNLTYDELPAASGLLSAGEAKAFGFEPDGTYDDLPPGGSADAPVAGVSNAMYAATVADGVTEETYDDMEALSSGYMDVNSSGYMDVNGAATNAASDTANAANDTYDNLGAVNSFGEAAEGDAYLEVNGHSTTGPIEL